MSDNLEKRLERASNEQSGHNMVAVVKGGNNRRTYIIEYNIPAIIRFIIFSVRRYEKICNTKLPFEEILNEVGKKLGITKNLLYYLLDDKSRKYIFEQLNQPVKENHKIGDIVDLYGLLATETVLVKNGDKCLEKGKEKDTLIETLLNYLKPEIGSWEIYKEDLFYKIRFVGYNLKKRPEEAASEQLIHNMVVVKELKDDERRYVVEYNVSTIIGLIESSVRRYEKICNVELPFEEILNEVGKKLGITEDLSSYLSNKKSIEYIFEQLNQPAYSSGDHKIGDIVDLYGLLATETVLVKNGDKCLEKGKEKDTLIETLLNYLKPEIGLQEDYNENQFYKIRAYKL
jgi:rRNA processing protein Gar1